MLRGISSSVRLFCTAARTEAEKRLTSLLEKNIPGTTHIEVNDVSNGCGSMYSIFVEASSFKGMTKVAQHKKITSILSAEIEDMHGLTINTKISK